MRRAIPSIVLIGAVLAVACSKRSDDAKRTEKSVAIPTPAASPLPPRAEDEDPVETAKKLEAKVQSGDLSGMYTPEGFDLVTIAADGKTETTPFPEALHKNGESILDAWVAPNGALFCAGFMYTGVPGPDTGAVYRKDPAGTLRVVFTKPAKELAKVWGRTESDVYAAGSTLLVHWDGAAWKEEALDGVVGTINGVWGTATDLYLVTNAEHDGQVYVRKGTGAWKKETTARGCFLRSIGGAGATVWAGGDCGLVLRRGPAGSWKEERREPGGNVFGIYAASEHDVYAAGLDLLRSAGDGNWSSVPVHSPRIFAIAGSGRTVYALGTDGVYRGSGTTFTKMSFDATACMHLAASDRSLHCIHERRVAAKSVPR